MGRTVRVVGLLIAATATLIAAQANPPVLLEGARLIAGDGTAPIEDSAILIRGTNIVAAGRRGAVAAPADARRINLAGKTIIPSLIDAHTHLGYTDIQGMVTSAASYTRENLVDHLTRYAYYGLAATLSLGTDTGETAFQVRSDPRPGAALFRTAGRGIASPGSGPPTAYNKDAPHNVTTEAQARAAVREEAAKQVDIIKIWVDDRGGTAPKLTPALYGAIIDEAHMLKLRVIAHIFALEDAKGLLRAGVDGFAHGIRDKDVDAEVLTLFKQRPNVFVLPNLPDSGEPQDYEWIADTVPAKELQRLQGNDAKRSPEAAKGIRASFALQAANLARLHKAGVRIGFGSDAGASVGWPAHLELADMVTGGMTPGDVIVAATRTSAEILRLSQLGTIAAGKSADLVVLDANPLDDIGNTRRIARVYVRGQELDRAGLRKAWTGR